MGVCVHVCVCVCVCVCARVCAIELMLTLLPPTRRTPLHWATVCENPEVIRALLATGGELVAVLRSKVITVLHTQLTRTYKTPVVSLLWTMPVRNAFTTVPYC